jgi:hypothetical protein
MEYLIWKENIKKLGFLGFFHYYFHDIRKKKKKKTFYDYPFSSILELFFQSWNGVLDMNFRFEIIFCGD